MGIKKSLYSISIKNKRNFTQEEIDQLQIDFGGFLTMFLDSFLMPPITTNDKVFEIAFEENSFAKSLIENFVFHTNRYDEKYDVVFLVDELT